MVDPNYVQIVFAILFFVQYLKADNGCSNPGVPVSGILENPQPNYSNSYRVEYSCPVSHQLFGDKYRYCSNGVWSGNIPICGTKMIVENVTQSNDFQYHVAGRAIDSNYSTCAITYTNNKVIWFGEIYANTSVSGVRITTPRKTSPTNNVKLSVTVGMRTRTQYSSAIGVNLVECLETVGYVDDKSKDVERLFLCPQNTKGNVIYVKPKDSSSSNSYRFMELCEVELFTTENLSCRLPDNLKNGHRRSMYNSSSHYYIFTCNLGYQLYGVDKIYCNPNGTWNPRVPICVAINCTRPPYIDKGYYKEWKKSGIGYFAFNDTVEYFCDPGYELSGSKDRFKRCVAVNQWSGDSLVCQPTNRSTTPFVSTSDNSREAKYHDWELIPTTTKTPSLTTKCSTKNRKVNNGLLIFGNFSVSLECDDGFEPVGVQKSICEPSKDVQGQFKWQPPLNFECKATISPLGSVADTDGKDKLFCPSSLDNGFLILGILDEENFGGKVIFPPNDFGGKHFREGTKIHAQCEDKMAPVECVMICKRGNWTKVHYKEKDARTGKVEIRSSNNTKNELIVPIIAFLIGVGSTIILIGLGACVYVYRKSRLNGSRPSQSLFHINLTNNVIGTTSVHRNNNNNQIGRMNISQDDEHIYQIPAYEDILSAESLCGSDEPDTPKRREPSSGLPLLPIYSQPFENDNYRVRGINSNVHIYAEPLRETLTTGSTTIDSSRSTESLNYLYSQSRYSSICTTDSVFIEDEDQNSNNQDLNMVDNDLYVSEDDSFHEI